MELNDILKKQNDLQVNLSKTNLTKSEYLVWTEGGGSEIYIDNVGNKFVPLDFYLNENNFSKRQIEKLKNILKKYESK